MVLIASAADVATVLTPVAILGGAIVGVWYARANHRDQLRHDRDMRERDATREIIGSALAHMTELIRRTAEYSASEARVREAHADRIEFEAEAPPDVEDSGEWLMEQTRLIGEQAEALRRSMGRAEIADAISMEARGHAAQLAIRFPENDPLPRAYSATGTALDKWKESISDDDISEEGEEALYRDAMGTYYELLDACREWSEVEGKGPSA